MQDHLAPASPSPISVDLLRAWQRADDRRADWTADTAKKAICRYVRFLLLAARHPGEALAPTVDIDVMWHLHMLAPRAYVQDCQALFGDVLDHDGGFGKAEGEVPALMRTFDRTAALWQDAYGEPYVPDAGCGSTKCWHDCKSRCWHACSAKP